MYHVYIGALRPQPGSFNQPKKCHLTPPTAASEVRDLDFGKLKKAYCKTATQLRKEGEERGRERSISPYVASLPDGDTVGGKNGDGVVICD